MYPSIDAAPAASLAATGATATTAAAAQATTSSPSSSYPSASSVAGSDGPLFPLLRVQVASKLRVAPQVMVPPLDPNASPDDATAASIVPRSNFTFDFDVEKKAVERVKNEDGPLSSSSSSSAPWTPPDPWRPLFDKHNDCSREEVALAASLAARAAAEASASSLESDRNNSSNSRSSSSGRGAAADDLLEKRHLAPLRQLASMGFDPKEAAGALCLSRGDLAAATDACLAAAAAGSSLGTS